ncbi:MAG: N-acetylglucosamine-6-phosphate deacetylase, partial [Lentisphaeria bacterium]
MPSVFRHVRIVTPDDICERDLLIDDSGTITSFIDPASPVPDGTTAIDGGGCYAFPGMIDALTHGYGPYLYSDAESAAIADNSGALPKHG